MINMNYIWINEKNREFFSDILPEDLMEDSENICIGAVDDENRRYGGICFRYALYQIDVLWVFVVPEGRLQGVGSALLDLIFGYVMRSGSVYPISARFEAEEDGTLYPFFISYDKMQVGFSHYRYFIKPNEFRRAKLPQTGGKESMKQECFFDLSDREQGLILAKLQEEEDYVTGDRESWKKSMIPELCRCIRSNGELKNLIFVGKREDGNIELSYLYSVEPKGLAEMLMLAAWDAEEYDPNAALVFDAVNDRAYSMAEKIFPMVKPVPVYEALW